MKSEPAETHPDPVTGGQTAIRGAAASVDARTAINGREFSANVRSRESEAHRGIEQATARLWLLFPGEDEPAIGQRLIDALRSREVRHPDRELQRLIDELRERLPLIDRARIEALEQGPGGGESGVYFDEPNGRVYKIVSVNEGYAGYGFVPGELSVLPDGSLRLTGIQNVPVLEFLARHERNNQQGGMVFNEFAGMTEDGALVMRQPLVPGLKASNLAERPALAKQLGLHWLNAAPRNAAAVGSVGDRLLLVDDLHELNLMVGAAGRPYIVDANSRWLSPEERKVIALP